MEGLDGTPLDVRLTGTEWELGVVQGTDGGDVGGSNTDPLSKAKGDSESSEATA
ncbi:hypothetical protein PGTUg99_009284 [Puccinia graminis f. sp. tritici]|uniref:Uncharacterized protein n=1 Tax=Puccinia graminis f. sp. tritici TaxID=56615 RepID=A0A5B0QZL0_PUCGR|nr:hypothetical protein PGTUg99_009284 [Puccinia graminis f. sp. tritici]